MPVQTAYGRVIASAVENEFANIADVRLLSIDEPQNASYLTVLFEINGRRVQFKLAPERAGAEAEARELVQRHVAFARRTRKQRK